MNRFLIPVLMLMALAFGALPAKAVTIVTSTSGSVAEVFLNTTSSGNFSTNGGTFNLSEKLIFGDTSKGKYGEAYTYIPISVSYPGFITATVNDLKVSFPTNKAVKALEWLSLALYEYTGSGFSYLGCGNGGSLCTLQEYDSTPPSASISSVLNVGTQYLLRVGFGLCGCSGSYGGIKLTVATTPIPPAILMLLSGVVGLGGIALRRRKEAALA